MGVLVFQSRLTCHEYQKFKELLDVDIDAAMNYKITFDRCDQASLQDVYEHYVNGKPLEYEQTFTSCKMEDWFVSH